MAKFINEGGSSNRPPLFEGEDYYYSNDKMELFLRSQDNNAILGESMKKKMVALESQTEEHSQNNAIL
ncbi:phytoalexin-deficient 4-2 protein, partial [Trifolium medium]|nr:phytoalexin-deficient 4-2 protein [Trifolium medium]